MSPGPRDAPSYDELDPFGLPAWLGESKVVWSADHGLDTGHRVAGRLTSTGCEPVACDLLAVDDAYPAPVASAALRVRAHQVWQYGEVLLVGDAARLVLAIPGARLDAGLTLAAVARLAHAVGAAPGAYAVLLVVD